MSQPIKGQGGHLLVFPIGTKNTNLVEEVEILLPIVEFCSAVSEEKSQMSQPIKGLGDHLVFTIGQKNTNLAEDFEILLPVKFHWILFSGFRGEVKKCLSQSEARAAILFFRVAKKHKPGRGHWVLASCQVSLNSVQWFQRSRKCAKLTTNRRTDDGQRVITIVHLSLRLRCT